MFNIRLYFRMIRAGYKTLGLRQTLVGGFGVPAKSLFAHTSLLLDHLFYPGHRRIQVKKPVFILGHPRSGTTFVHRLLADTNEFATFRLWEILAPSLTARKILGPFVKKTFDAYMEVFENSSAMFADGGHTTGTEEVEEEELLFGHRLDSQLDSFLTPLAFDEQDWPELVFCDRQPERWRRGSTRFLHACFKRQLLATGRSQILAKMPYSTMRIRTLLEEFPDARIVYLVRSPFETIPSHLSLHRSYFANRWGLENIPPEALARYYRRRYTHNVDLYRYFFELQRDGQLPQDQVMVVVYNRLLEDLEGVFKTLTDFAGIRPSEALLERVRDQAARQKTYSRKHANLSLEEFGLTQAEVRHDLDFVFREYGFDANPPTT